MREIELSLGFKAFVDDEDYDRVSRYRWYVFTTGNSVYASTMMNKRRVMMHRFILEITDSKIHIDHKDHNGLNNQRVNLRECSAAENKRHSKIRCDSKNKYKGVSFDKDKKKWRAQIFYDNKRYRGPRFKTQEEAALDYNRLAKLHHGEFAFLNVI